MIKTILVLFLIGHVLGDFYLQSNELAVNKNKSSSKLIEHGLIYLFSIAISLLPVFGFSFIKWVVLVSIIHFLIDAGMTHLHQEQRLIEKKQITLYLVDQSVHLVTIFAVTVLLSSRVETIHYTELFNVLLDSSYIEIEAILYWILAIAITMRPVSITIKKILYQYQPTTADAEDVGHPGAGSLIGILERLIILVMLSQNQYGAIGFVLTAKSIARYNKIAENPQFSEYYLLGTLLSMLLVIITYLMLFV